MLAVLGSELGALTLPVRIEGHTDSYQFGDENPYTNWELSADRANAARRLMTRAGLPPERIVRVSGRADTDPIADDPGASRNRRIAITLLRKPLSRRPGN
jgi:chemotaxis protein MotB